jgi:hypothetical protein
MQKSADSPNKTCPCVKVLARYSSMVSVECSSVPAYLKLVRPVEVCSFRHGTESIPPTEVVTPYAYPSKLNQFRLLAVNNDTAYGSVWRGKRSAAVTLQFIMFASSSNGDGTVLYWHDPALVGALPLKYTESIVSEASAL